MEYRPTRCLAGSRRRRRVGRSRSRLGHNHATYRRRRCLNYRSFFDNRWRRRRWRCSRYWRRSTDRRPGNNHTLRWRRAARNRRTLTGRLTGTRCSTKRRTRHNWAAAPASQWTGPAAPGELHCAAAHLALLRCEAEQCATSASMASHEDCVLGAELTAGGPVAREAQPVRRRPVSVPDEASQPPEGALPQPQTPVSPCAEPAESQRLPAVLPQPVVPPGAKQLPEPEPQQPGEQRAV